MLEEGQILEEDQNVKRVLVGRVCSAKRNKTVTVLIERRVRHKLYKKYMVRSKKYHAHDETNQYQEGDIVEIRQSRPISRTKSWVVVRCVNNRTH